MATNSKTGGREPGTPNKVTKELRLVIKELLDNEMETLGERLNTLGNKDRLELIIKLMAFVMPKYQEVKQDVSIVENTAPMQPIFRIEGIPKSLQIEFEKDRAALENEKLAFLKEKEEFEKLHRIH